MPEPDPQKLLGEAMNRYRLEIMDNISEARLSGMPLPAQLRVVGAAVMDRTDLAGFRLGLKLLRCSREVTISR
ncbi:hypothetical protein GQF56_21375 [Rhodobacter sphaeroides]|jgi:hypothetical protein|uniref:Uncharacterized protein n=2 Tax=Cereibacter sphaeroides TaxID=1063 RepID=U5NML2_CERS4|nr:hypothetical protein [Cereibacter sphaeroides]AGY32492.1 hypothetical protein RSP_7663 [Cereibacter sphaeroides 2.4.1]AMJ50091.1 hypothetical protein APX01_21290 [Cereibacter sphaeroides]ANS36712.1 hypothetical protein A3858_20835 [Cereibacter sphaeroides]ATN65866.1 hypothetical protein A3857_21325 [Cereibacter sphaeroides]AXC64030.1 hypothetical protein DQL45_21855 [Cereibacter sphaeroides 2.4.1]